MTTPHPSGDDLTRSDTVIGLDLVRFAAAFLVTCFHLSYWTWASPTSLPAAVAGAPPAGAAFAWFGWIGVEIFFVLSGLLIARSANGRSPFAFVRARVLRLFPALWICASASLLVRLALDVGTPRELAEAYARTMPLLPLGPWIDSVYWTLAVEVMFYALVGVLLVLDRFDRASRLFDALAMASAIYWTTATVRPDAVAGWAWPLAALLLLRHGCFFALGGMIWQAQAQGLSIRSALRAAAAAAVCVVEIRAASHGWQAHPGFGDAIVPVAIWAAAVAAIVTALRWARWGWTPGRARLARTLGLATYPLYLLHGVVGAAVLRVGSFPSIRVAMAIAVSVALALVVSAILEPRLRSPLRRTIDRTTSSLRRTVPFAFCATTPVSVKRPDVRQQRT